MHELDAPIPPIPIQVTNLNSAGNPIQQGNGGDLYPNKWKRKFLITQGSQI